MENRRFTVGGDELRAAVRIARALVASDLGIKTVDELALTSAIRRFSTTGAARFDPSRSSTPFAAALFVHTDA